MVWLKARRAFKFGGASYSTGEIFQATAVEAVQMHVLRAVSWAKAPVCPPAPPAAPAPEPRRRGRRAEAKVEAVVEAPAEVIPEPIAPVLDPPVEVHEAPDAVASETDEP